MRKSLQIEMIEKQNLSYGGELLKTRKGREHGRPLDSRQTMHLVLRSSKAKGKWSFKTSNNEKKINAIINKFSNKYGVKILSLANVGNHLHFHIKLQKIQSYKPFIRAITAAIAMAITGASRWQPLSKMMDGKFWDYRPFTRIIVGWKAFLNLKDYIQINKWEGFGYQRSEAKYFVKQGLSLETG